MSDTTINLADVDLSSFVKPSEGAAASLRSYGIKGGGSPYLYSPPVMWLGSATASTNPITLPFNCGNAKSTKETPMGGETCNHCGARREWTSSESSASYRKDGRTKSDMSVNLIGYRCGTVLSNAATCQYGKDGNTKHTNTPWTVDVRGDDCK